jgi:drug/metabolite transporter (DMT)-like permease
MIYLLGSIVLTSYLTLSFKYCEQHGVSIFQAIVFNYITCVITGSIVNGAFPIDGNTIQTPWFKWACLMGLMFISIFNVVGLTAQKMSVAVASVANKLSLIIPVVLSVYLYQESVTGWKLVGVVLALLAVALTCYPEKQGGESDKKPVQKWAYFLPVILFFGSGLLDALINHVFDLGVFLSGMYWLFFTFISIQYQKVTICLEAFDSRGFDRDPQLFFYLVSGPVS